MPDSPLNSGIDFASRLVSNVYGLHKQDQDRDRADAERTRQSMISVLEGAANSGNVNPEDMPALYSKLFELSGAKSKDIATLTPHLQSAFSQPNTPRTSTFNHQSVVPSQTIGEGDFQTDVPEFNLPPIPTTETINTPAIRLMSPEERANRAAQAQVETMRTTYPQRKKELDEATQRKLELQGAALDAKEKARINAITTKGGVDATRKFNERVNMFLPQAGYDAEVAKGLASKSMIADEDAALAAKQQQAATGKARANYLSGILDVHKKNADTLSRRADVLVQKLQETVRHDKASEANVAAGRSGQGGAVGRNLKVLMANTKELYTALTPLNNAIVKLETDPLNKNSDGTLIDEVRTQVDDLKSRRDAIQTKLDTARKTWLPQMPEPIDNGIVPAVPQMSTPTRGIIRRANLGAVRAQNPSLAGLDDNALIQHLQAQGYAVK